MPGTLATAALLLPLLVAPSVAAPLSPNGLQEQEINLKLRILVPRDSRPLSSAGQLLNPIMPRWPASVMPDAGLTLPAVSQPPTSLLSSLSSIGSPIGSLLRPGLPQLTQTSYLVRRPVSTRKLPLRTVYSAPLSYASYAPTLKPLQTYSAWPPPQTTQLQHLPKFGMPQQYISPLSPSRINITMVHTKPGPSTCNCNNTAEGEDEGAEEPAPIVEEDADDKDVPPMSEGIPDSWLGYIPPDLLDHAKKVLQGRVNLQKDKVHFNKKWKHSNYTNQYQQQHLPGTEEALWNEIQENLRSLDSNEAIGPKDDFHDDHDSDFDDLDTNLKEGSLSEDYEIRKEDDGRPSFIDYWGNHVPKYVNNFKDPEETEKDAERDYNNDPHGFNPEYTKGLWSDSDDHLQVFSGFQKTPNEPKPQYDNGLGEGLQQNYDKYVANNGTWVGSQPERNPNNLQDILLNSVSYEKGLKNPNNAHLTYADVIRYLNSKHHPVRRRPRIEPIPSPRPTKSVSSDAGGTQINNTNLVDVNQLIEALILHKEKEQQAKSNTRVSSNGSDEDTEDDEDDEDEDWPSSRRASNAHTSPPSSLPDSVCKGIREVGLAKDGQKMAHVQGVVCVKSYDHASTEGAAEGFAEGDNEANAEQER